MRKQVLYVNKAGFHYGGPGNVGIGSGSRGTVFLWFHPTPELWSVQTLWKAWGDAQNSLTFGINGVGTLSLDCKSGGTTWSVTWPNFFWTERNYWMPVTCTWDFTAPEAGQLRMYVNGQEAPTQVNTARAPLVGATRMYLGPAVADASSPANGCFDNVAVWDGVMSKAQHEALWGQASNWTQRQNRRRRLPRESDGAGVMTFLATFDGTYDAMVAAGDGTARWEVGSGDYDEFALIDDGARGRGLRHQFFLGMPRHDGTDDDRAPIQAVLTPLNYLGVGAKTTLVNHATHSEVKVSELMGGTDVGQGTGWLREWVNPHNLARPATVRLRVNCPSGTNPVKTRMSLGPFCYVNGGRHGNNFGTWGTGELLAVTADGGNTATSFRTNLPDRGDGYWTGAELTFRTGANAGTRLKVTGYTASTGALTVAGALATTPSAGDKAIVDHRGRLLGNMSPLNELQNMEAWLWEEYETDKPWIELEGVYGTDGSVSFARQQRGRMVWMDLPAGRSDDLGRYIMFGRNQQHPLPASFACDILLESVTVEGPGNYQVMSEGPVARGRGFELADTFLVQDPDTGQSSRVWRQEGVTWRVATPEVDGDPDGVQAELQAAGTWRHTAWLYGTVDPQATLDRVTALIGGTDADGVWRGGYLSGSWDAARKRVTWTEEAAPTGRSNPFLAEGDIKAGITRDAAFGFDGYDHLRVIGLPDGMYSLLVGGTGGNPDHYFTRAYHGAADRWSFDWEQQWWAENPMLPGFGGVEKLSADGGTATLMGNRDAEWIVAHNPYARRQERRYLGCARLKTLFPLADQIGANRRLLGGWTSGDLRTFFMLPHGTALQPLGASEAFTFVPRAVSDDFTALHVTSYGDYVRLWASDDDRHFQAVSSTFLSGNNMRTVFVVGGELVMYYMANGKTAMAHLPRDRETYYELATGANAGVIETAALLRPEGGWSHLEVNCEAGGGALAVEVLDAATDEVLAGYDRASCEALAGGIGSRVKWQGRSLRDATADAIRLRFVLTRAAGAVSPALYAWYACQCGETARPTATALKVEGRESATGVTDPTPTLSWQYSDATGSAQAAYQVLVASSAENLGRREGDVWDTGVVEGAAGEADYGGPVLADDTTYFWAVRVRNAEGVWSEEW